MDDMPSLRLDKVCELALRPTAPFHFDGTVHKPSHFPEGDRLWQPGTLWLTDRLDGEYLGLKVEDAGTRDEPCLHVSIFCARPLSAAQIQAVTGRLDHFFDLSLDLTPFNARLERDELMRPILDRWRGMRGLVGPLYDSLIIYVVLQNATVRRSVQMLDNLLHAYGTRLLFDDQSLFAFWQPEDLDTVSEDDLRALKVGYRARSIKRLSTQFARGEIDEAVLRRLPNPELKRELLKLYGIGPASVWYLMSANFHRHDAFEYISPWECQIYARLLFDQDLVPGEQILQEVERRWGEWRALASLYLFEDLFWRRRNEPVPWLEALIRL